MTRFRNKAKYGTAQNYIRANSQETPGPLDTPCWIWTRSCTGDYGRAFWAGEDHYAHRFAFISFGGMLTTEKPFACHRCDIRLCCNPEHIFAGTQADNIDDCRLKGRNTKGRIIPRTSKIKCAYRPRQSKFNEALSKHSQTIMFLFVHGASCLHIATMLQVGQTAVNRFVKRVVSNQSII